jgi:hypothetical protein
MEMSTKPSLNTPMLPNQLNKLLTLLLIRMIQPTASINNVIFLQDPQARPIGGCMSKNEYLPSLLGGMGCDQIFKPIDLSLIDGDFVRGVDGITEYGGAKSDEEGFVGDLTAELGGFFFVGFEVHFEVFLVCFELESVMDG